MARLQVLVLACGQGVPDEHVLPPGPADHVPPIWGEAAVAGALLAEVTRVRVGVLGVVLAGSEPFGPAPGVPS